jgi:hypothetical protein
VHPAFAQSGDGGAEGAIDLHGEKVVAAHAHVPEELNWQMIGPLSISKVA